MRILGVIKDYMWEKQSTTVRFFHFAILVLVISQIITSNFMGFTSTGEIKKNLVDFYGTWTHIVTGLTLFPLAFAFIFVELKTHGFNYFFNYLSGDFSQIKKDISQIKQLKLPDANANGIATLVQGLGLGALALVLLTGSAWFLSWISGAPWAKSIKELHELMTGLIEAYVAGHGFMGLLHIYQFTKK